MLVTDWLLDNITVSTCLTDLDNDAARPLTKLWLPCMLRTGDALT